MSPSPQVVIAFIAAAVSFGTAGFAYLRQDVAAHRTFVWLMVAMGFWGLLSGLHTLAPTQLLKVTVAKAQYLAIASVPLLWVLVAHQVVGLPALRRRHLAALAAIPSLTVAAAWTNDWHGWLWARITPAGPALVYHHGPWFWVAVAYNYALLLATFVLLVRALRSTPYTFHPQLWVMIGAVCLPWVGNVLYLARAIPIPGLDPTPLTFILCGVLFSWALTNYRFLDLVPIARSVLLDHMEDGVLVIDRARRLVDANPAARRLARIDLTMVGRPLHVAMPPMALTLAEALERGATVLAEPLGPDGGSIEVRASALAGPDETVGWLVTLRDITTQQSLLRELRTAEQTLRSFFDSAGVMMGIVELGDDDVLHIQDNASAAAFFGTTVELTRGQWASALGASLETRRRWLQAYRESERTGAPVQFDDAHETAEGQCWLSVTVGSIGRAASGRTRCSYVALDVTARIVAEQELRRSREQLEVANMRLSELARTDSLTGLRNRGAFNERLAEEVGQAADTHAPLSLLLLDIDHFKAYNDTFGHVAGDGVLRAIGRIFQEQSRQRDVVARYGGEEFAIVLPNTDEAESLLAAERIRHSVERTSWPGREITVSIGVATRCEAWTAEELIELADGALYTAKERGRNQVAHACQVTSALKKHDGAGGFIVN